MVALKQRNLAKQQQAVALQRLAQMTTANGLRQQDEGNLPVALLWFAEALKLEAGHPADEEKQRIRLASALQLSPQLAEVQLADENLMWAALDPEGRWLVATSAKDPADPSDLEKWDDPRPWQLMGMRVWDIQEGHELPLPRTGDGNPIVDLQFTPQTKLALTFSGNVVEVWDVDRSAKLRALQHEAELISAGFDAQGARVVTTSSDQTVRIWDTRTGQELFSLPHDVNIGGASLSGDGQALLAKSLDKTIYLWDLQYRTNRAFTLTEYALYAALSDDGKRLFTLTSDGLAKAWDVRTGEPVSSLGDFAMVHNLEVSPDGERVAMGFTGSADVTVWDLKKDEELFTVHPGDSLLDASFSRDGKRLATGGHLGMARVWDAHTGAPLTPPLRHSDSVTSVHFSADGNRLVTASGRMVRVWDLDLRPALSLKCGEGVISVGFSKNGERVLAGTASGAELWSIESQTSIQLAHQPVVIRGRLSRDRKSLLPPDHPEGGEPYSGNYRVQVRHASYSPDGRWIATAGRCAGWPPWIGGQVGLWEAGTGKLVHLLTHQWDSVHDARFSSDSRLLATATSEGITLWDVEKTNRVATLGEGSYMTLAEFSQDGKRILGIDFHEGVRVWNVSTGEEVKFLQRTNARSAVLSPDNRRLAVHDAGGVFLLDTATGASLAPPIQVTYADSRNLAFSHDGTRLLVADADRTRIWNAITGSALSSHLRHSNAVLGVAFSPDGGIAVTSSADKSARLWDGFTGSPLSPPLPHPDSVSHVAFAPDGRKLVTASGQECFVWDIAPDKRSTEELMLLSRLLACGRIDETSTFVPLDDQEFYSAWLELRRRGSK